MTITNRIKSKQEIYDMMMKESTFHQQPCPIDGNFSIITFRIPNQNVQRLEEHFDLEAFKKILNFCSNFTSDIFFLHHEVQFKNNEAYTYIIEKITSRLDKFLKNYDKK